MHHQVVDLLQRVKTILPEEQEWFRVIREWYLRPEFARNVIAGLFGDGASSFSVVVNGQVVEANVRYADSKFGKMTWVIPASWLDTGENTITVAVEPRSEAPLCVAEASVERTAEMAAQIIDMTMAEPKPARFLALLQHREAHAKSNYWQVGVNGGRLQFGLRLSQPAEIGFTLALAAGPGVYLENLLRDFSKRILTKVRKRIAELWDMYNRRAVNGNGMQQLCNDLNDLEAYARLHEQQIERALNAPGDATLSQAIDASGDPAGLIRSAGGVAVPGPMPTQAPVYAEPAYAQPAYEAPARFPTRRRRLPGARGGAGLKVLLVAVVVAAPLGYAVFAANPEWKDAVQQWFANLFQGRSGRVSIDSPGDDNQNFAAGMQVQIATTAEDPAGVKSMALTVESGADLLANPPENARFDFAAGTSKPGSKIFTLNLKKEINQPSQLVVKLTMTNANGKTFTATRKIRVGGSEPNLVFQINPHHPKPGEFVHVTVQTVNVPKGSMVSFDVRGNDSKFNSKRPDYHLPGRVAVGDDGTIRFTVHPAEHEGVKDDVEVRVEGMNLVRRTSYVFGDRK